MIVRTSHGEFAGRTLGSILRREYGKNAAFTPSGDPASPEVGMVTEAVPGEINQYSVLARVLDIQESPAPPDALTPERLRVTRHLIGLSIDALAKAVKINSRSIRRWETGDQIMSSRSAEKVLALRAEHDRAVQSLLNRAVAGRAVKIPEGDQDRPASWWVAAAARAMVEYPEIQFEAR